MFNIFQKKLPNNAPDFLIIGAQKAGTTALYNYLTNHNYIQGSKIKEIHFFNSDDRYSKGLELYHSYFLDKEDKKILNFEASPSYLVNEKACERIYNYNKNIKIIVLLRNPIERAYSAWNMYVQRYEKNINWFFDNWANKYNQKSNFIQRDKDNIFDFYKYIKEEIKYIHKEPNSIVEAPVIIHGYYSTQIKRYYEKFPQKNILIIENQDLNYNTINELQRIENFLKIPNFNWNKNNIKKIFKGQYKQQIDNKSIKLLRELYDPHNQELFDLIGKKYTW